MNVIKSKFTPKPRDEAAKDIRKIYARFFSLRKNIKNKENQHYEENSKRNYQS